MNEESTHLQFLRADLVPSIDVRLEDVVPWIRDCDGRYYQELIGSRQIDAILARWVRNPRSEISLQTSWLLLADEQIVGGYVAIAGRHLARRRESDLIDLARRQGAFSSKEFRQRIQRLHPLLAPVAPNDLYLSKLGAIRQLDGPAPQQLLLDHALAKAQHAGLDHLRADVDCTNQSLKSLLLENGFDAYDRRSTADGELTYLNLIREV